MTPTTASGGSYEIHVEPHGPHWIAWITREGGGKPEGSVVLVAGSQEEAEARARSWAEQSWVAH
jgi:hypothetical protein